ncbi:hypothetical protein [Actinomadura flavalba]|uniref:hypothetical protein n=1 Tax=Actinomadura flavalba TaxID=1120938 RepID=UPI0012DE4435|nr:hypothetical protein [Actinomadura flavalba]
MIRRLVVGALGAMVVFTGAYLVVYTARWEWQRALMAGQLLIVALVVLVAVAGAARLRRIEALLAERTAPGDAPYGEAAPGTPRFRWLESDADRYGVFIPVLLGAGIVVSALAALVERIAAAFGRGDGRRAVVPAVLTPPSGGVLAGAPEPPERRGRGVRTALAAVAIALVAGLAVAEIAEHTQDRPDAPPDAPTSTLVVAARTHGPAAETSGTLVTRLWEYCRGSTRPYLTGGGVAPLGGDRYAVVVEPALGEHALRRLRGCLQDAMIDGGRFEVVSVRPDVG